MRKEGEENLKMMPWNSKHLQCNQSNPTQPGLAHKTATAATKSSVIPMRKRNKPHHAWQQPSHKVLLPPLLLQNCVPQRLWLCLNIVVGSFRTLFGLEGEAINQQ